MTLMPLRLLSCLDSEGKEDSGYVPAACPTVAAASVLLTEWMSSVIIPITGHDLGGEGERDPQEEICMEIRRDGCFRLEITTRLNLLGLNLLGFACSNRTREYNIYPLKTHYTSRV